MRPTTLYIVGFFFCLLPAGMLSAQPGHSRGAKGQVAGGPQIVVKATVDKPITLHIDADSSGEIHVHSTPEQEIEFPKGTSTKKLTIKQPGIIDVEDHKLNQVIVQLQVEQ